MGSKEYELENVKSRKLFLALEMVQKCYGTSSISSLFNSPLHCFPSEKGKMIVTAPIAL